MVIHLFIGLILIAVASMFITQGKRRKIWSLLLLVALGLVSWLFIYNISMDSNSSFMYQWLPYSKLQADFSISSSARMQGLVATLIWLLAGVIILNITEVNESYSLNVSVLNILSFVAMILLISSRDMFQLMFASALLAILCFYIPNDAISKRKLFIYSFLAEISCFTALAVVYAAQGSISLSALNDYVSSPIHKDFVAALLLFSLGIKSGLFLLNNHYNSLSAALMNRLSGIFIMSLPFSALVILAKLSPLISSSHLTSIIAYWLIISAVVAGLKVFAYSDCSRKIINLSQVVYCGLFYVVFNDNASLYTTVPQGLIILLLSQSLIYYTGLAGLDSKKKNYAKYYVALSGIGAILYLITIVDAPLMLKYSYMFICGLLIKQLLLLKSDDISNNDNSLYNIIYFSGIIIVSIIAVYLKLNYTPHWDWKILAALILALFVPTALLTKIGQLSLWNKEITENIYNNLIVLPLKWFGRILWLAFDFVFIERGIIATSASGEEVMTEYLRLIQSPSFKSWLLWLLIGIVGLVVYVGVRAYE